MGRYAEVGYNKDDVSALPRKQGLYIVDGPFGGICYVGRSNDVHRRLLEHLNRSDIWVLFGGTVKIRWIQNWKELRVVEREKIRELDPSDNVVTYADHEYPESAWGYLRSLILG